MIQREREREKLVSVIVPVYNVEPYLCACLDSILNQTYKNLEICIVASTSPDKSVEICDYYATLDDRITIIHTDPLGLSAARNTGIENTSGKYLSFIDSDDVIVPDFIETLYRLCEEHDADIAQVDFTRISQNEKDLIVDTNAPNTYYFTGREMCYNLYRNTFGITSRVTWSKLYHRSLFKNIRFPFGKIHEDNATTYQLFYEAQTVAVTTKKMYNYRLVETSIMGQPYSIRRLDMLLFAEEAVKYFGERNECELVSLSRDDYFSIIIINLRLVQKHLPDSEDVERELIEKRNRVASQILHDKYIPMHRKLLCVFRRYFLNIAEPIENLVRRVTKRQY